MIMTNISSTSSLSVKIFLDSTKKSAFYHKDILKNVWHKKILFDYYNTNVFNIFKSVWTNCFHKDS